MQNHFCLLNTNVMPIFMIIALEIIITMHFSINCLAVICSPPVIHAILREATSETYGPGSILHHISFPSTCQFLSPFPYFAIFYFPFHKPKIPKILLYPSLSDLTFASDRERIDNPFIALGASCLIVCAGIR